MTTCRKSWVLQQFTDFLTKKYTKIRLSFDTLYQELQNFYSSMHEDQYHRFKENNFSKSIYARYIRFGIPFYMASTLGTNLGGH